MIGLWRSWERDREGRRGRCERGRLEHGMVTTYAGVVHDAVVLSAITTCSMAEDDLLLPRTGGFVEDLRHTPDGAVDVDVLAGDVVFGRFFLGVGVNRAVESFTEKFEQASCQMAVLAEFGVVAVDADAFLFDVHALEVGGRLACVKTDEGVGGVKGMVCLPVARRNLCMVPSDQQQRISPIVLRWLVG